MNYGMPMKKTHSANIGGTVFQVEEDAYEKLQAYLQSIEAHFRSYPDLADIIADIEGRIAEQLMQREFASQVVRISDVDRVIASMGRTEQFAEGAAESTTASEQAKFREGRKLFRDPDHKVIAGVAAGLAAYLGLPVLLVRILFLGMTFFFGTALVAYLLLWALAPVASSTTDRLQMRGRPLNLASIDQGVRDSIASIPQGTRSVVAQGITAVGSLIHLLVVSAARLFKWVAGIFVVGVAALGMLFLTVSLVVALVNASAPPLHPDAAAFFESFGSWQQAFKISLYLAAAIPLAVIIATGLRLFWGVNRLNTRGLGGMLGVWVVSLLAAATIWSGSYPQLRQFWDEYPVARDARQSLDRFSALVATTSPLTEVQSKALMSILTAEHKRLRVEDRRFLMYPHDDRHAYLAIEEQNLTAREESNRRIMESAKTILDAQQLAAIQESMTRHNTNTQAALQQLRERLDRD
jgi:phage shock protein PspC (stress-responsive transcriptional regulator)